MEMKKPGDQDPASCLCFVVIRDPLGDRAFERRASMPPLQFPECRLRQMRDEGLLAFSLAVVTRNINGLSEVPAGTLFSPVVTRNSWRFLASLLAWHSRFLRPP